MAEPLTIRAVVFEDRGRWVAQCLEYDLCTSAEDRRELTRKLASQLRLQIMLDRVKGRSPFQGLSRAPQRFWDMYSANAPEEVVQIRGPWLGSLFRAWRGSSRVQARIALATS